MKPVPDNLRDEMTALLNRHSCENASDTPDFILAGFLVGCLEVWDKSVAAREEWYGRECAGRVEPPVEWRVLQNGERVEEGDEIFHLDEWYPVGKFGFPYESGKTGAIRRRVSTPVEYDPVLVHVDLQNGDLIWEDDEYLSLTSGKWEKTSCFGEIYNYNTTYGGRGHRPHRRSFTKGYRWLRKDDVVLNDDEILEDGKWSAIDETGPYDPVTMKPVRRKI